MSISFFSKSVFIINIIVAFLLLLTYLTPFIDPATLWPIAFLGLAYPFILAANLLCVLYWLLGLKYKAALSIFVIALGLPIHKNSFGFHFFGDNYTKPVNSIRIMSFNTHNFRKKDDKSPDGSAKSEILKLIRDERPDIISFQEFYTKLRGIYNIIDSLKKEGLIYYYFEEINRNKYQAGGIAIFSRYPIKNKGILPFFDNKRTYNTCIFTDINVKGKTIRVFNTHLQSISFQPIDYEYIKKIKDLETDPILTRRIARMLKRAFEKRSYQARLIASEVEQSPYPILVCGDFNDTPISYAFTTVSKNLHSAFTAKGCGFGRTYNGSFPNFQIDYILYSKEFEVKNYYIIKKKISDHYPIRSDLTLTN
ncbi:endonuclease/exonuclease/phosphatase family protein [Solitalea koreensis]|uniref:Metal-dependent hydrolase, endonuclease/exonuclease/phosphatase family n=1 Tax=Solitalea koreensis TaxID=543615 RepID=A0A521CRU7_9SPHI|nr:endonuclease/exonuclease/phosphatase family protein [Solitalea koreensis]SMO62152.1 Metal-dependent hydrolase, endonuclease/exonuclease/phosphatase family [Solitalea koreensis]